MNIIINYFYLRVSPIRYTNTRPQVCYGYFVTYFSKHKNSEIRRITVQKKIVTFVYLCDLMYKTLFLCCYLCLIWNYYMVYFLFFSSCMSFTAVKTSSIVYNNNWDNTLKLFFHSRECHPKPMIFVSPLFPTV